MDAPPKHRFRTGAPCSGGTVGASFAPGYTGEIEGLRRRRTRRRPMAKNMVGRGCICAHTVALRRPAGALRLGTTRAGQARGAAAGRYEADTP
jgi:hypothetical protein